MELFQVEMEFLFHYRGPRRCPLETSHVASRLDVVL